MTKKYYNNDHLNKIIELLNQERYEKLIKEFNLYFMSYPNDSITKIYYIDYLIKIGKFDEAEEVFMSLPYTKKLDKINKYTCCVLYAKLKCYQKDYHTALTYLKLSQKISNKNKNLVAEAYLNKKINKPIYNICDTYIFKQLFDYNEDRLFTNLEKYNIESDVITDFKFYDTFPIKEIYSIVKEKLPTNHIVFQDFFNYYTIFKYNNCGEVNNKKVDYFKVAALIDTNQVITMHPCYPVELIGYTDLNPKDEISLKKVNRLSQVEKFNRRYNR